MKGVWIMGYCLKACLEGVQCADAICYLDTFWVEGQCLQSALRVPGRCYWDSVWTKFGRCLDGVWTVSVFWVIIWWVS